MGITGIYCYNNLTVILPALHSAGQQVAQHLHTHCSLKSHSSGVSGTCSGPGIPSISCHQSPTLVPTPLRLAQCLLPQRELTLWITDPHPQPAASEVGMRSGLRISYSALTCIRSLMRSRGPWRGFRDERQVPWGYGYPAHPCTHRLPTVLVTRGQAERRQDIAGWWWLSCRWHLASAILRSWSLPGSVRGCVVWGGGGGGVQLQC